MISPRWLPDGPVLLPAPPQLPIPRGSCSLPQRLGRSRTEPTARMGTGGDHLGSVGLWDPQETGVEASPTWLLGERPAGAARSRGMP